MESNTFIDLFAGCGGASLGFKRAGFVLKAAVELDPVGCRSYASNHLETALLINDIRLLSAQDILEKAGLNVGQCTVILGCPPCQGFSRHRLKGSGLDDPRNSLVTVFAEIVSSMHPAFFVFENVPGILKFHESPWYAAKESLTASGYRIVEGIVNAADYGTPQRRRRFTAIGCRLPLVIVDMPPNKTHRDPREGGILPPWRTVRDAISDLPPLGNGEQCVNDPLHCASIHSQATLDRIRCIPHDGGSRRSLPSEMQLECHKKHSGHLDVYGRLWWDKVANTITSGCILPSKGRFLHPEQDRGITLREAARLQGFPDDYRFEGNKQQIALQIGNAVPPSLAHVIALRIKEALDNRAYSVKGANNPYTSSLSSSSS